MGLREDHANLTRNRFSMFAHDDPNTPLGKRFYDSIGAVTCWSNAKDIARSGFKNALKENEDKPQSHIMGPHVWTYRYSYEIPIAKLWAVRSMAAILNGDESELFEELELSCFWYERTPDGRRFLMESPMGKHDPNPKKKRIGKYGN